ncbi:MAG: PH domain-containing protein [Alphaproteobacteria bacterium]
MPQGSQPKPAIPVAGQKSNAPREKPVFSVRSRFNPLLVLLRHPVRLALSLMVLVFLMPELMKGAKYFFNLQGEEAEQWVIGTVIALIFLPQWFFGWLDCRAVRYDFYKDHLEFTENFMLRDRISQPYRNISSARIRRGPVQVFFGLSDLVLTIASDKRLSVKGKDRHQVVHDIRKGARVLEEVTKLLKAAEAKDSAGSRPPA